MQSQSFILVAVLLGCLVMAAAAQAPAARHLASTVGGRDDPKVQLVISKQRWLSNWQDPTAAMPCARCLSARAESYLHILALHLLPWQIRVVRSSTRCPGTCRVRAGPAFQGCHACASGGSGPRGLQGAVCRWQGPLQGAQGLHGTMPEGGHPEKVHV